MSIRLIDNSTICLKEFIGENIPSYAILSHTWVEGEEITYQEMMQISDNPYHPAKSKSGYRKIVWTCQEARNQSIDYSWIDTCCIDKTSSAELSEAINSMFKWYQDSEVCYAFLSDMQIRLSISEDLPKCRWFTRGWCLQELLAPKHLKFYDRDWEYFGSKVDLCELISTITTIDAAVLSDSCLLLDYPVTQRMSWAAKRKTTRREDMAYCLLGIFDVNMPLLYGEGHKAFIRLQEEIIKKTNDLSTFAFATESKSVDDLRSYTKDPEAEPYNGQGLGSYCDLFATSPRQFRDCGSFQHLDAILRTNQSFTLTNNGLHFRNAGLILREHDEAYWLPLQCGLPTKHLRSSQVYQEYMCLKKIGPAQFIRVSPPKKLGRFIGQEVEEVFIITSVVPTIFQSIQAYQSGSIRIVCPEIRDFRDGVQCIRPRDRWDASQHRFFTGGGNTFEGLLRIYPALLTLRGRSTMEDEYFYLYCRIEFRMGLNASSGVELDEERHEVALVSRKTWEDLENTLGKAAGLAVGASDKAKLDLKSHTVKATMRLSEVDTGSTCVELSFSTRRIRN